MIEFSVHVECNTRNGIIIIANNNIKMTKYIIEQQMDISQNSFCRCNELFDNFVVFAVVFGSSFLVFSFFEGLFEISLIFNNNNIISSQQLCFYSASKNNGYLFVEIFETFEIFNF